MVFLRNARAADGKTAVTETDDYKIERAWDVLSLFTDPTNTMTFDDYLRVEFIMEQWYLNGKLASTGHAYGNYYDYDINGLSGSYSYGSNLMS